MRPQIGSLCSGYGGLDLGLMSVVGGTVAWHAEYDDAPSKILAHHWPDVPNLRDVTTVDWAAVEPVDWLTGGFPCQPFSLAGKRKGATDERHLWPNIADAIGVLRPGHVLLENVAGHLSLGFGTVLGDLARLGYDATWGVVRASEAGAPHRRARVFIVATDTGGEAVRLGTGLRQGVAAAVGWGRSDDDAAQTPADTERGGRAGWTPHPQRDAIGRTAAARPGESSGERGAAADTDGAGLQGHGQPDERPGQLATAEDDRIAWGTYEPAIARWGRTIGRPAPAPVETGPKGGARLSPRFVEWLMGLPVGHVTDVPGLARNAQLKALGNGVVPQQAALALRMLLPLLDAQAMAS